MDSKAARKNTARIKERMAFSRSRRHRRFSSQHRTDQIASPGTGFGDMLARAPGRRSAAKLLSDRIAANIAKLSELLKTPFTRR
jgi:hypothetical protein